ncbi:transcription factor HES-3-like [Arapaima gigas]
MVAASDGPAKAQLNNGRRVSKPMMEKKRRARINECLEELKTLMENYYTNYIRKRKLEKADILEMTVKHLRNLQKTQQGHLVDVTCAEYQAGFKSCLNGVNQFLLRAEQPGGFLRVNVLKHLSAQLCTSASTGSSTADSDAPPRLPFGVAVLRGEHEKSSRFAAPEHSARRVIHSGFQGTEEGARFSTGGKNAPRLPQELRGLKGCVSVSPHSYWRPWQKM